MKENPKKNPLAAFLSGEANDEQKKQVEDWLNSDSENRDLYKKLSEAWDDQEDGDIDSNYISSQEEDGVLEEED